jgi:copper oxidase (laccase) domain-containing protein
MVNLQGIVQSQLTESGVNQKKIIDINECTFCLGEKYHSFRREGKSAGRMIAILGWQ